MSEQFADNEQGHGVSEQLSADHVTPSSDPQAPPHSNFVAFSIPVGEETTVEGPTQRKTLTASSNASPGEIEFVDHYSLRTPSCSVQFQKTKVHVYPQRYSQLLLEETFHLSDGRSVRHLDEEDAKKVNKREITVKRMSDTTFGLMLLRAAYTLVAVFIAGFLLVYALQLLLYVFLDIVFELGLTSDTDPAPYMAFSSLLSLPVYLHGMACALVIAFSFVSDTWGGHQLMRMMYPWSVVVTDWMAFLVFIGIPLFTGTLALFAGNDDWYQIVLLTWFGCIIIAIGVYALAIVIHEIKACIKLIKYIDVKYPDQRFGTGKGCFGLLKRCILLRQVNRFSGSKKISYIAQGGIMSKNSLRNNDFDKKHATSERYTVMAKLGLWLSKHDRKGLVRVVDPPVQIYSTDESRGILPVTTGYNWSLERIYCRNRNQRRIAVVKGPGAMTRAQARSNFACALLGKILILLAITSLLLWLDLSSAVVIIASLVIIVVFFLGVRRDYSLFKNYRKINELKISKFEEFVIKKIDPKKDDDEETNNHEEDATDTSPEDNVDDSEQEVNERSEALYNVKETYRVTRPTNKLCWIFTFFELLFLFLIPFISFIAYESYSLGLFFLFIGVFSGLRYYLNAPVLLQELGALDYLAHSTEELKSSSTIRSGRGVVSGRESSESKWTEMHRISEIVGTISKGRSEKLLKGVFYIFTIVLIVLLGLAGATNSDSKEAEKPATLLEDFKYEGMADLRYPTCKLEKGLVIPGSYVAESADYAFLSQVAYRGDIRAAQHELNQWFGAGQAVYNETIVEQFKKEMDFEDTRAEYRLVTFPSIENFAVIAVRGTQNAFDALTDLQIWSAAALMQGLRFVLPAGDAWTPSLHNIINFMSILETAKLSDVAFYKETTKFVEWLKVNSTYTQLQITGHSLGGGLSIISGAQTKIPAIAISGPNAVLSRLTFDPPVKKDALNSFTFNIIPERDVVPMIDDKAMLYQMIECNAATNDPVGCHSIGRSLCQLLYACGSNSGGTNLFPKPIPCFCHDDYGFPKPTPTGNRTYAEACKGASNR